MSPYAWIRIYVLVTLLATTRSALSSLRPSSNSFERLTTFCIEIVSSSIKLPAVIDQSIHSVIILFNRLVQQQGLALSSSRYEK